MKSTTERFIDATRFYIKGLWTKRKNPLYPKDRAKYPAQVTSFVHATVDGKRRLFRVNIKETRDH